jgi:hypothetical protein
MTLQGQVKNGVVVLQGGATLPDGTLVDVTLRWNAGIASTAAPATESEASGSVAREQQEALLALIGIWKTDHPPSDEEVERLIEEARMKKYG